MNMLRAATLTTLDAAAAASRFCRWFGYLVAEEGEVPRALAESWGAPVCHGRRFVLLQPASRASVFLRFVEGEGHPDYRPLHTYGWAALELCVRDTLAVHERLQGSPFRVIGPPRALEGLPTIFPMQVQGPEGETVFLTQILDDLPEYDLPRAESLIDRLFILVLACSDLRRSMRWFADTLGIALGREIEITYSVLSAAFGLPAAMRHRMATGVNGRDCFLELDQYPPEATARPGRQDALPPGIALATFIHSDLGAVRAPWIRTPEVRNGALYGGGAAGTLRAPDGTLVEVVQA